RRMSPGRASRTACARAWGSTAGQDKTQFRHAISSIEPLLRGEPARLVPLFRRHPYLGDAEGPDMAFRVAGAIGAVAVELSLGLLQDLRARFARTFAMSVDVLAFRELDVDGLRVLAADGFRALVI